MAVAAASCTQGKSQQVHVYGANWSRLQLPMLHYSEQEAIIVQGLEDQKLITVYKPPCGGHDDTKQGTKDALRSCGDVDHALCREAWRNCEAVRTLCRKFLAAHITLPLRCTIIDNAPPSAFLFIFRRFQMRQQCYIGLTLPTYYCKQNPNHFATVHSISG